VTQPSKINCRDPRLAATVVIVGIASTAKLVPLITTAAVGWDRSARIGLATVLIAPLAVAMGTMYPSGVRTLARAGLTELLPWAWAINGVAAVLASVVGMFAAMEFGYTAVLVLGGLAYTATIWAAAPHSRRSERQARPG
jgi:hypothetical protein